MKKATLYFHYPCFDGLVSAALAWEFLEHHEHWQITTFVPVDYSLREAWLKRKLRKPCAVVDFLYHPGVDFWADHHATTMVNNRAAESYRRRTEKQFLFFDNYARSCAGLLYEHLRKHLAHKPHFKEMVAWAQKIDSAAYASVEEAILGDAPALKISRSLVAEEKSTGDYANFLLCELRAHDLNHVAALPEVKRREESVRRKLEQGLKEVRSRTRVEEGDIVIVDARKNRGQMISRYAPYYAEPNARYSIGITRSRDRIGITAMRNPWKKFRGISIGRALEQFGGGGHQRVGAVRLPPNANKKAADVVESLLSKMRGLGR